MIGRRDVIHSLALGGTLSALAPDAVAAQDSEQALQDLTKAVRAVREEVARQASFWEIASVRDQLRTFLRSNGKFPDFIEVGVDIWMQVYDWHVRFQQPIMLGRTGDGRQTITLMTTSVIMRADSNASFIGPPYDNR